MGNSIVSKRLAAKKCVEIDNILKSQGYCFLLSIFTDDDYNLAGVMTEHHAAHIAWELMQRYPNAVARAAFQIAQREDRPKPPYFLGVTFGTPKPLFGYPG